MDKTECKEKGMEFQGVGKREVVAAFNGGRITSDGGALLLRELEEKREIIKQFSECFIDHRNQERIEHRVAELVAQRIYGLVLGYEDLNDHEELRKDPLLALLAGKADITGEQRRREQDKGKALAGKSTLNRLELRSDDEQKNGEYKKIAIDQERADSYFVQMFMQSHTTLPKRIILDLDATDDILQGAQEGSFYHGYYGNYCYLPLYIFCGDYLLLARLRASNIDQSAGAVTELARIVKQIRAQWPAIEIWIRADSGFCREEIMAGCEANRVEYILGLPKNSRLLAYIEPQMQRAKLTYEITQKAAPVFADLQYQTLDSWTRARRVVAKAEQLEKGANPRFVVTSLAWFEVDARPLYEDIYCHRGEMEKSKSNNSNYLPTAHRLQQ